ncbi:MAG: hypothetical protein K5978_01090 [Campylobacter sp.]|nr:hypothetical protein [Campylobacter sp.]
MEFKALFINRLSKYTYVQGSFTNEHFQYLDKANQKWTHIDNKQILKGENDA